MTSDDERKDDWLTPTQWRAELKRREKEEARARKERDKLIQAGVGTAAQLAAASPELVVGGYQAAARATRRAASAVTSTRLAVGVGGAAVGVGTAAALAILAGAASYFGTRWLIEKFGSLVNKDDRAFRAAQAYREARREAQKKLGRELTPDEHAYLAAQFKSKLKSIGWG